MSKTCIFLVALFHYSQCAGPKCSGEGDSCVDSSNCKIGLNCVSGSCVPFFSRGAEEKCAGDGFRVVCEPGLYCNGQMNKGTCVAQAKSGQKCTAAQFAGGSDARTCEPGYICDALPGSESGTCKELYSADDQSIVGDARLCLPWLYYNDTNNSCTKEVPINTNTIVPPCIGNNPFYIPTCVNGYDTYGSMAPIWCRMKPNQQTKELEFLAMQMEECLDEFKEWYKLCHWSGHTDYYKWIRVMHSFRQCAGKHGQGEYPNYLKLDFLEAAYIPMWLFTSIMFVVMLVLFVQLQRGSSQQQQ